MIIKEIIEAIEVSVKVSGVAALLASLLAVPAALFLASRDFRGKNIILLINQTWLATPTVVIGLLFYILLSRREIFGQFNLLYTQTAMTIGQIFLVFPLILGFAYSALQEKDKRCRMTALSLGATPKQASLIVLREAKTSLIIAILAGFGRAISEVGIAMMLGGNIKFETRNITTSIALETAKGDIDKSLILGFILLIITLSINLIVYFSFSRDGKTKG